MSNRPLRFGVMCDAAGLTEFARQAIAHVTRDGLAQPVLLIVNEQVAAPSSWRKKLGKSLRFDGNLWHLHERLFPLSNLPAYQRQPLEQCLPGVEKLVCAVTRKGKWSEYFSDADVAAVESRELDFILKFAYGITRGAILKAARYGVWSFHHDDEEKYRGGPPAFWEIQRGDHVTGALLQRLTDRLDGGVVLHKCFVATDPRSYRANLQRIQSCSWHLVRWACLDLLHGHQETFTGPPSATMAPIYRAPNDWQMLRFGLRIAGNWIRYKLANQRIDEWNVGLVEAPQQAFLNPDFAPAIRWLPYQEPGQMIADPFLLPVSGEPRILVEEFDWLPEKGRICELRGAKERMTITPVIDEGLHMSYPYVFVHEGATYAIPECAESCQVRLYRLDESLGTWSRVAILLDGLQAVDSTVFIHDGRWWMMHSADEGCGPWSLFLWHAPSLLGPWQPHVANPVKTDVSSTRPAGNPFFHAGHWYRPAQDGRLSYGGALSINRIDKLTTEAFRETVVRRIAPDPGGPYPHGIHTLSGQGTLTVVDGKRHTWPLPLLIRRQLAKRFRWVPTGFRYSKIRPAAPLPLE